MPAPDDPLAGRIEHRARRRRRARRHRERSTWFGLGMYGMVGWSVAVPTVLGAGLGIWIDGRWPSRFSWTLMLLAAGVVVGCWNAWYWVSLEQRGIRRDGDEADASQDNPDAGEEKSDV